MKKTLILAAMAAILLSGCATNGPRPYPHPRPAPDCRFEPYDPSCRNPFPDCRFDPYDPFCRNRMPMPMPPIPRPMPPHRH